MTQTQTPVQAPEPFTIPLDTTIEIDAAFASAFGGGASKQLRVRVVNEQVTYVVRHGRTDGDYTKRTDSSFTTASREEAIQRFNELP